MGTAKAKPVEDPLGRLTTLGPKEPWQVAFLLPERWIDLRSWSEDFGKLKEGAEVVCAGRMARTPETRFQYKVPMTIVRISDRAGYVLSISVFGEHRDALEQIKVDGGRVLASGTVHIVNGRACLNQVTFWPAAAAGWVVPVYAPKKGVMGSDLIRSRIARLLKASVDPAADWLAGALAGYGSAKALCEIAGWRGGFKTLLMSAHYPKTPKLGHRSHQCLERLAGLYLVDQARRSQPPMGPTSRYQTGKPDRRIRALPFTLSISQRQAIDDLLNDMEQDKPMRRLLSGDVGSGKTAVFGVVAASVADAGGRAYILMPSTVLARQLYAEISGYWPNLLALLVVSGQSRNEVIPDCPVVLIATTALLHKDVEPPDLLIIDEPQRFSIAQKEKLCGPATNVCEATATCIPRSQALLSYGLLDVSQLQPHVEKKIKTRIWKRQERRALFDAIQATLDAGYQVIAIYPRRGEGGKDEDAVDKTAAEDVAEQWNRLFPSNVALAHGGQKNEDNQQALNRIKKREANILIATTVVEVGVNLPGVRRICILGADSYGLAQLHQLRGRVARTGGEGWCDLYLAKDPTEKALERLQVLVDETDGFVVAEKDLELRGAGDVSSSGTRQSGDAISFLYRHPVPVTELSQMMATTFPK